MDSNQQDKTAILPPPISPQPPTPTSPPLSPPPPVKSNNTTLAVLLLLFLNPIGVIYMWLKTSWSLLIKILVTFFSVIFVFIPGILAIILLITINPIGMYNKGKDAQRKDTEIRERTTQEINSVNQNKQFSFPTRIPTQVPPSSPSINLLPEN